MRLPSFQAADRLLDATVAAFAVWTVCCNATVVTGGTGYQLLATAAASAVAISIGVVLVLRRRAHGAAADSARAPAAVQPGAARAPEPCALPAAASAGNAPSWRRPQVWALAPTLAVIGLWPEAVSNWLLWSLPAALVLLYAVLSAREPWPSATPDAAHPDWHGPALWLLAVGGALVTACLHLPNTDDVLYVNMAAALADEPGRVLFSEDTLHGASVIPHAAYHVHAFELLAGALSFATHVAPLPILHLGFAVFAGLLTPLAWARLCRLLDPARATFMVVAVMAWYVLEGTTPFGVSMHAFARLFQGKAVLVTAGVPVIAAYGIAFGLQPSVKRLLWLGAAQVAGLGLSSTGIWLCPLIAVTSVAATQPLRWRSLRTLALACASSAYVLAMGGWVLLQIRHGSGSADAADVVENAAEIDTAASALLSPAAGFERIRKALTLTFLTLDTGLLYSAFMLLAWPLARTAQARRYLAAFLLVGLFLLCSPWLAAFFAHRVIGFSTYPRVTWFLPYGVALAICFVAPIATSGSRALRAGTLALSAALVVAFFLLVPQRDVFRAAHLAWPPALKVDRPAYEAALWLKERLPAKSAVLAPRAVSLHLPMLLDAPLPLMTKPRYFDGGDPERKRRALLMVQVERRGRALLKARRQRFREQLDGYAVRAVVLTRDAYDYTPGMRRTLEEAGFRRADYPGSYVIWMRERAP